MSYTTVMVVKKNYDVVPLVELRNSHRHGPLAWRNLGAKYFGFATCYDDQIDKVCALKDDPRITEPDFAVLLSTFDRFVCPREHFASIAALYDEHAAAYADAGHFAKLGAIVRRVAADPAGYVGFGYQPTSVCDNFWVRRFARGHDVVRRPYNLARDVDEKIGGVAGHFYYDPDDHPARRVARGELVLVEGGAS